MKICCINPALVLGPQINESSSTSVDLVLRVMKNNVPGIPNIFFSLVDVRDVALAHLQALELDVDNERYIINNTEMSFYDLIMVLKNEFKPYGYKFSVFKVSKWMV